MAQAEGPSLPHFGGGTRALMRTTTFEHGFVNAPRVTCEVEQTKWSHVSCGSRWSAGDLPTPNLCSIGWLPLREVPRFTPPAGDFPPFLSSCLSRRHCAQTFAMAL